MANVNKPVKFDDDPEDVAALKAELEALRDKIAAGLAAQGTQRAETPKSGSVHDGPVAKGDAP